MGDFKELFRSFSSLKVGVIGDVMLDTYMWGKTERISPEAPVPVVTLHHKEYRIGGAGNVALNCQSLGAQVSVLSVLGDDEAGNMLQRLFEKSDINTSYLVKSAYRITTSKTRIISRNQQMLRLDEEITLDLEKVEETLLLDQVKEYIRVVKPDVIIFEDYNKGILSETVIREVIRYCREAGVITTVDPKRKNFFAYKGVDIFKPNLKEVKEGLNLLFDEADETLLRKIHKDLQESMGHRVSFITLSDKGVFYQSDGEADIRIRGTFC